MSIKINEIEKFGFDSFKPYLSAKTFEVHYNVLHKNYVNKLLSILQQNSSGFATSTKNLSVFDIISMVMKTKNSNVKNKSLMIAFKNSALGHLNHTFFGNMLSSRISTLDNLYDSLYKQIETNFSTAEHLINSLVKYGNKLFSNGGLGIVYNIDNKSLEIITTKNHNNPLFFVQQNMLPIFTIDLGEHAYIIDYGLKNLRTAYISDIIHFIDGEFVNKLFNFAIKCRSKEVYVRKLQEVLNV